MRASRSGETEQPLVDKACPRSAFHTDVECRLGLVRASDRSTLVNLSNRGAQVFGIHLLQLDRNRGVEQSPFIFLKL